MIIKKTVYDAQCDKCYDYFSFDYYNDKKYLVKDMKDSGWKINGKRCYCSVCRVKQNMEKE